MNVFRVCRAALLGCLICVMTALLGVVAPAMAGGPLANAVKGRSFVTNQSDPYLIDQAVKLGFRQNRQIIVAPNTAAADAILAMFPYAWQRRQQASRIRTIDSVLASKLHVHCGSFKAGATQIEIYGKDGCTAGDWMMIEDTGFINDAGRRSILAEVDGKLTVLPQSAVEVTMPQPVRRRPKFRRKPHRTQSFPPTRLAAGEQALTKGGWLDANSGQAVNGCPSAYGCVGTPLTLRQAQEVRAAAVANQHAAAR